MYHRPLTTGATHWFAAQLKPNGLRSAEQNLARQGFAHFTPRRLETRRVSDRMRTTARPLFPGYIFVQCDPEAPHWRALNATRGLTRVIVGDPRRPRPLPDDFIAAMMMRCDAEGILRDMPALRPGDLVRVVSGPMADLVSRIEKLQADDRVELLMALMGRETRVSVAAQFVEKLGG